MPESIGSEIETLFRRESGRLLSVLTRIFGPHNLELAEDVLQEAFVAAMNRWSEDGIPVSIPVTSEEPEMGHGEAVFSG